jgi:hypothetical protein
MTNGFAGIPDPLEKGFYHTETLVDSRKCIVSELV